MYKCFFKRIFDFFISFLGILVLLPFFLIFTVIVALAMRGNPFFIQARPGKGGKIFKVIKYRTMNNKKDADGKLLSDKDRLTKFGKLMRKLSIDELPELFNIFAGQMSIVGPRPLLVQYLPLYNEFQAQRHKVRPGLTGLAQVSGRNAISWAEKFEKDVYYVNNCSMWLDIKIFFLTIKKVLVSDGISQAGQATMEFFVGDKATGIAADIDASGDTASGDTANNDALGVDNVNCYAPCAVAADMDALGADAADANAANMNAIDQNTPEINILITSCGRRVELVKEFKKARQQLGIRGNVVVCDMSAAAPAMMFADIAEVVPKLNDKNYLSDLIEIIKKNKIALVVPTIDTELLLLAENKEKIESETGAKVLVSDLRVIELCNNKKLSAKFFEDNGFGVPHTLTENDIESENYAFPLFIKPLDGSSSVNAFKINTKSELEFFKNYVPNPIIQQCISGIEYTVDVFIDFEGDIISVVPRKRLQTRSGEILKGEIDLNSQIIADVTKMINVLKPIGHITVQGFWCDDNLFRYIEINPRFGGGAPMSIMSGANSCRWLYMLLCGRKIDKTLIHIENGAVYSRFDDCVRIV